MVAGVQPCMCLSRSASEIRLAQTQEGLSKPLPPVPALMAAEQGMPLRSASTPVRSSTEERKPASSGGPRHLQRWDLQSDDSVADEGWPGSTVDTSRWRYQEFGLIYVSYMTMLMARG